MAEIQAFRGVRYDLGHVGALADVVAPPYDVIDAAFQDALYKRHPANVIRLELNRDEPGDNDSSNRYTRAAKFLRSWRAEGLLFGEAQPSLYVYHQRFDYAGHTFNRRGFMARVRLERFGEGNIYPHEETMSGPKQDRLLLTRATRTNLSQVFGLYPDPSNEAQPILEEAIEGKTPVEAEDHLGVIHRMWPVADLQRIAAVTGAMGDKPIFIADGHHRYETACNYRDELAKAGKLDPQHPANSVLMMCVGMDDPGLIVMPTHRMFRGLPEMDAAELTKRLGDAFHVKPVGEGADFAPSVWSQIESRGEQGMLGLFTGADDRWSIATITDAGRERMRQVAAEHSADWCDLGVSILHRLLVETLLDGKNLPKPEYVHLVQEVVDGLEKESFPLAALVMPATVEHIRVISQKAERMPAKSTYFYPKLLSGMVFNPLE